MFHGLRFAPASVVVGGLLLGPVAQAQDPAPVPQDAGTSDEAPRPEDDLITLHGCIVGSSLKATRRDAATVTGAVAGSDIYRLQGSREIRRQIRKARNALVKVTGRFEPGPAGMVWGKKVGGVTVGIGSVSGIARPTDQRPDATPVMKVDAITILAPTCK